MTPVRLEPAASGSRVKHSATEPLHSPFCMYLVVTCYNSKKDCISFAEDLFDLKQAVQTLMKCHIMWHFV